MRLCRLASYLILLYCHGVGHLFIRLITLAVEDSLQLASIYYYFLSFLHFWIFRLELLLVASVSYISRMLFYPPCSVTINQLTVRIWDDPIGRLADSSPCMLTH